MASSQSSNLFGSDQDGFEDALMAIDLETPTKPEISHSDSGSATPPARETPRKRKLSQTEDGTPGEDKSDIDRHAMETMRERDDKNDIYGASSFGGYGQYFSRKRQKLQIQYSEMGTSKSNLFKGVEVYVRIGQGVKKSHSDKLAKINGRTEPPLQVLREMIVEHGGKFHAYLTHKGLVTHVIAMNLTPAKVKEFQNVKVVRPDWIVESVKAGVLLPWRNFKLQLETRHDIGQGRRIPQATLPTTQVTRSHDHTRNNTKEESPVVDRRRDDAMTPAKSSDSGIKDPIYMTDPVTLEQAARIPGYALNKSNIAAQRLMSRPGWQQENTAASGTKFINSYYQHSRLHHLSMWKAELKDLVAKAQERYENEVDGIQTNGSNDSNDPSNERKMGHGVSMKGAELLRKWDMSSPSKKGKGPAVSVVDRIYMHCDFDCFFVSVGLLDRPELRGKPVVVCHSQGIGEGAASTSEIASSSYEARDKGIRNGMSLGQARQLCPEVITMPYEFERYKEVSLKFYTVLLSYADELQAVSVDEALLDVSHTVANLKVQTLSQNPDNTIKDFSRVLAEQIRERMFTLTGCQVSIGIGENLLLARIASRRAKPANIYHLSIVDAQTFLAPLPLDMIWGVGYQNKKKAEEKLGIENIGDLVKHPKGTLVKVFGPAMGDKLWKAARGQDDSKLQPDQKRKSVSAEINFGIRFQNNAEAEEFIRKLGTEVSNRLQAISSKGRQLTLKVMKRHPEAPVEAPKFMGHGICETFSKGTSIGEPAPTNKGRQEIATNSADILGEMAWKLLLDFNFDPKELRGLGLQVTRLECPTDDDLDKELESGQTKLTFNNEAKQAPRITTKDITEFHPTEETLDIDTLEALPEDIRMEILAQLKIDDRVPGTSKSHATDHLVDETNDTLSTFEVEQDVPSAIEGHSTLRDLADGSLAAPIIIDENEEVFASKPVETATISRNVAHITRQLRPKAKAVVTTPIGEGAQTHPIFSKQRHAPIISEQELKELALDPDVFYALPEDVQREQLRLQRDNRKAPSATKKIAFGDTLSRFSKLPAPRNGIKLEAKFPEKVSLNVTRSRSGNGEDASSKVTIKLVELGDIQAYMKRWVTTSHATSQGPSKADLQGLKSWLINCMSQEGSGTGMEKVVVVLKWWQELLRKFWKGHEKNRTDAAAEASVGLEWWSAFEQSKAAVDEVCRKRYGGKISLR